jgi:hypothetical protein
LIYFAVSENRTELTFDPGTYLELPISMPLLLLQSDGYKYLKYKEEEDSQGNNSSSSHNDGEW